MKAGDFLLLKGSPDNIIEDVIAVGEHSPFIHVLSATSDQTYLNPTWPHILEQTGVLVSSPPTQFLVEPDLTSDEQARIAKQLRKYKGKHYGVAAFIWAGLCVAIPFLRHLHDPIYTAGVVCSTALAQAYAKAGCYEKLQIGTQSPESVSPADLARAWNLQ